ncbi:MAG: LysR family transcriptional regulator [Slackia sp.]|nr:LysR family transcriptional regulator [Slackia sp.]
MNTAHLEHFAAFAECETRATAAKKLYTSPQSISKSISALEREFGIALVQKSGRNTVLTPMGRRFYEGTIEVLGCIERLRDLAESDGSQGGPEKATVAIATAPFDSTHAIEARAKQTPTAGLSFLFGPSGSCLSAVEEGIADCALVFGKVEKPGMTCRHLFSFPPSVLIARAHPLAHHHTLRFEDMLPFPIAAPTDMRHCRQLIEKQFRERAGQPIDFCHMAHGREKEFFLRENGLAFSANAEMLDSVPSYLMTKAIDEKEAFTVSCFYTEKETADRSMSTFVIPRLKHMALLCKA